MSYLEAARTTLWAARLPSLQTRVASHSERAASSWDRDAVRLRPNWRLLSTWQSPASMVTRDSAQCSGVGVLCTRVLASELRLLCLSCPDHH